MVGSNVLQILEKLPLTTEIKVTPMAVTLSHFYFYQGTDHNLMCMFASMVKSLSH